MSRLKTAILSILIYSMGKIFAKDKYILEITSCKINVIAKNPWKGL